uniref:Uncharacterized protein n=1 Tax=Oryza brachyantha TaxID=4533 RepID=J3NAV3_ORYBR
KKKKCNLVEREHVVGDPDEKIGRGIRRRNPGLIRRFGWKKKKKELVNSDERVTTRAAIEQRQVIHVPLARPIHGSRSRCRRKRRDVSSAVEAGSL